MTNICICGGGSLGHVCAGVLASQSSVSVNVYSQQPGRWSQEMTVTDLDGRVFCGHLNRISDKPEETVAGSDIILLCLPGFAIEETLIRIRPYVGDGYVGSIVCSTGFFFAAHRILGTESRLFGFQRTPFIARLTEYGRSANLLGYKPQIAMAVENASDRESFRRLVERLLLTPTVLLESFYEVSLTNSNPILHTGRLYSMWKDWDGQKYDHNILFYREWTVQASSLLIEMDSEFMKLLNVLPVAKGSIPSLLDYYESTDADSLCNKIRSIRAFQSITSPMKEIDGGWVPDFKSRYFTEDFPYGLFFIKKLAEEKGISTPTINRVFEWGMKMCNR